LAAGCSELHRISAWVILVDCGGSLRHPEPERIAAGGVPAGILHANHTLVPAQDRPRAVAYYSV